MRLSPILFTTLLIPSCTASFDFVDKVSDAVDNILHVRRKAATKKRRLIQPERPGNNNNQGIENKFDNSNTVYQDGGLGISDSDDTPLASKTPGNSNKNGGFAPDKRVRPMHLELPPDFISKVEFDPASDFTQYIDEGICGPRGDDAQPYLWKCVNGYYLLKHEPVGIFDAETGYPPVATIDGCTYLEYRIYACAD